MTPTQLQAIKDKWAKATPGNWKWIIRGNSVQSHAVVCHDDTKSLMPQNICSGISPKTGNAQAIASAPTDIADLLAEIERLRCCGNCEHFETVCGEGKCFVECEKPAWRFDKKVRYTDGSGKCEKWEAADNG